MIDSSRLLRLLRSLPFEREVAGGVVAGALMLLAEIRFEHRQVLGETWHSWIPLVWLGTLVLVGGAAWLAWHRGGRKVLAVMFALTAVVGLMGIWFHSGGHPLQAGLRVASAWTLKPGDVGDTKIGSVPPALAPGALIGLGLLGLLACLSGRDGPSDKVLTSGQGASGSAQPRA